jgi:hypothetical protein
MGTLLRLGDLRWHVGPIIREMPFERKWQHGDLMNSYRLEREARIE